MTITTKITKSENLTCKLNGTRECAKDLFTFVANLISAKKSGKDVYFVGNSDLAIFSADEEIIIANEIGEKFTYVGTVEEYGKIYYCFENENGECIRANNHSISNESFFLRGTPHSRNYGMSNVVRDIVRKIAYRTADEATATVEVDTADATTANVESEEQVEVDPAEYAVTAEALEVAVEAEINAASTMTVAEKFLEAKEEIRLSRGRYLGNDRFADQWQRHNGFRWYNISKKTAAFHLEFFHGLTINEFLTEQKIWLDERLARSLAQWAIDDQADFISDKIRRENKVDDEDVFSLLPALDELNDVGEFNGTSDALNKVTVFDEIGNEITTIVIGDEYMRLYNGELWSIRSLKYCARWSNMADQIGWYVSNGNKPWRKITDADEFFKEMATRGACTIEPGTPEPDDDFTAELAKLQAQVESARAEAESARDAFRAAQKVCNDAEQNCIAADNKAYEAEAAVEKFIRAKANALTKIIDNAPDIITAPRMAVTLQGGEVKRMKFDNLAVNYLNGKFLFDCDCDWQTLAEYDTPAQVETVIGELRAAIAHGSKEFIFPTFGTQVGGIFKELDAIKATA